MTKVIVLFLCLASLCPASDFGSVIVKSNGPFGPYPYDLPSSILDEPASWIYDDDSFYEPIACSLVYPAWSTDPNNQRVVVTLGPNASIVAGFDHKVADDINNPYGIDFIVFGNAAFQTQGQVKPGSDMDALRLTNPASMIAEKVKVEVAQDPNGPWYAFGSQPFADNLFPTNRFEWNSETKAWGKATNPLKPVDPNLALSAFAGLTVKQAIGLYQGSAGGTGFDLRRLGADFEKLQTDEVSGRRWIQYVRLSSVSPFAGEADAISDVAACGDYLHPFPAGDINKDCRVDLPDLAIIAQNWLICTWNCTE